MIFQTVAHKKLLKLQKKIFHSLKMEASHLLGTPPEGIRKYEKQNKRDFRTSKKSLRLLHKEALIQSFERIDVIFIADFHAFDQAQLTALKIMKEAKAFYPDVQWVIGLEMISSHYQNALVDFQKGIVSLEKFHEQVSYIKEWGFPWEHYAPIFEWARNEKVPLMALNRPKPILHPATSLIDPPNQSLQHELNSDPDPKDLNQRDQWAAGIITDFFASQQNKIPAPTKMIVLYGELHVGSAHLPKHLKFYSKSFLGKALRPLTIHQNEDSLYWWFAEQGRELEADVVRIKKDIFCVFSSTPWAKFQSVVNWAEGLLAPSRSHNSAYGSEIGADDLSMVQSYGKLISDFFELPHLKYEDLNLFTIDQIDSFTDRIEKTIFLHRSEKKVVQFLIQQNQRVYLPSLESAFLASASPTCAVEISAYYLLKSTNRAYFELQFKKKDFFGILLESAFGFFCSLILHPRRKCDLIGDHKKRIQSLTHDLTSAEYPGELQARSLVLSEVYPPAGIKPIPAIMGARYLGRLLGKKLYLAYLEEKLTLSQLKIQFFERSDFKQSHKELSEKVNKVQLNSTKDAHF